MRVSADRRAVPCHAGPSPLCHFGAPEGDTSFGAALVRAFHSMQHEGLLAHAAAVTKLATRPGGRVAAGLRRTLTERMCMRADAIVHISINMAVLSDRLRARIPESAASGSLAVPALAVACGVLDISGAPPRRRLFRVLADHAAMPQERERLEYFASAEGRDDLATYCASERRSLLDVRPLSHLPCRSSGLPQLPLRTSPQPPTPMLQVAHAPGGLPRDGASAGHARGKPLRPCRSSWTSQARCRRCPSCWRLRRCCGRGSSR